jgi:hypothetical protein
MRQIIVNALETKGQSQAWLGAEVAAVLGRPHPYSQSVVSQWLHGQTEWQPSVLFAVERALGLRAGDLSRHLGYLPLAAVPPPTTVEGAINADPLLRPALRRALIAGYREMVREDGL